jgi:hypothetical protein
LNVFDHIHGAAYNVTYQDADAARHQEPQPKEHNKGKGNPELAQKADREPLRRADRLYRFMKAG